MDAYDFCGQSGQRQLHPKAREDTGAFVAAAVSSIGPIGIDIENRLKTRDYVRLAEAAFGPKEAKTVAKERASAFYRIWTVREAISKAAGFGFPMVVDRQDRVPARMVNGKWYSGQGNSLLAHNLAEQEISLAFAVNLSSRQATATLRLTRIIELKVRSLDCD